MSKHSEISQGANHRIDDQSFADEATRLAFSASSGDVGKVYKQEDTEVWWLLRRLAASSPANWSQLAPTTSSGITGPGSSVNGNLSSWVGTGGDTLADSGVAASDVSGHIADTNNPHATPTGGRVIQRVTLSGSTSSPTTTSPTPSTLSEMTTSFTPTSSSSLIRMYFIGQFANTVKDPVRAGVYYNGSQIGFNATNSPTQTDDDFTLTLRFDHAPGNTDTVTVETRWATSAGTATALGTNRQMVIEEIS